MNEDEIRRLLERLGQALNTGDMRGVTGCFAVPALFLSEDGATVLANTNELEKLFAQAMEWYRSRGFISTKPELERVEILSERLASVDVRWPAFDASDTEKSSERSHYIMQLGNNGQAYIRLALTRTL
jgi:hypothetical protein